MLTIGVLFLHSNDEGEYAVSLPKDDVETTVTGSPTSEGVFPRNKMAMGQTPSITVSR
jgi:hypothetical protein